MGRYEEVASMLGLLYAKIDADYGRNFVEMVDEELGEKITEKYGDEVEVSVVDFLKDVWEWLRNEYGDEVKAKVNFLGVAMIVMEDAMGEFDSDMAFVLSFVSPVDLEVIRDFLENRERRVDMSNEEFLYFLMGVKALIDYNIRRMKEEGGE